MNKNSLIFVLLISSLSCFLQQDKLHASQETSKKPKWKNMGEMSKALQPEETVTKKDLETFAVNLIKDQNPTKDRCKFWAEKPKGEKAPDNNNKVSDNDASGIVACMLAGFKDVGITGSISSTSIFYDFIAYKDIHYLLVEAFYKTDVDEGITRFNAIYYTQKGKKNALLLQKYLKDFYIKAVAGYEKTKDKTSYQAITLMNHYLVGILLDYPIEAIEYFYKKSPPGQEKPLLGEERLASDKKEAEKFIADQEKKASE